LGIGKHIKIIDEYVPNEQVSKYFAACDIAVLPYTSSTGSGIVQTAFGCVKPVITTRVGSLSDVVKNGETGYLVEPENVGELAQAVIKFYKADKGEEFSRNIVKFKDEFSWERMRQTIEHLL